MTPDWAGVIIAGLMLVGAMLAGYGKLLGLINRGDTAMQIALENQFNQAFKDINTRLDRTITRDEMRDLLSGIRETVNDNRNETRRNGERMDDLINTLNGRAVRGN